MGGADDARSVEASMPKETLEESKPTALAEAAVTSVKAEASTPKETLEESKPIALAEAAGTSVKVEDADDARSVEASTPAVASASSPKKTDGPQVVSPKLKHRHFKKF